MTTKTLPKTSKMSLVLHANLTVPEESEIFLNGRKIHSGYFEYPIEITDFLPKIPLKHGLENVVGEFLLCREVKGGIGGAFVRMEPSYEFYVATRIIPWDNPDGLTEVELKGLAVTSGSYLDVTSPLVANEICWVKVEWDTCVLGGN